MPLWLIRLLPYGAAALAILAAVWYIDHRGYKRAEAQATLEKSLARTAKLEADQRQVALTQQFETKLRDMAAAFDRRLGQQLADLDVQNRTIIQPTLIKEIQNDPRQSDPNDGITDGMLRVVNQARAFSWPDGACATNADGSATCKLPAARPAGGQEPR